MGIFFHKKGKENITNVPKSLWDLKAIDIDGKEVELKQYKGKKVLVIVNVASACGLAPKQYRGLMSLYRRYRDNGLEILAFPCNQFQNQEPQCEANIKEFITKRFGANFSVFSKIEINGTDCHPVYKYLRMNSVLKDTKKDTAQEIPWNFAKFLLDSDGKVRKFYAPDIRPEIMAKDIEELMI